MFSIQKRQENGFDKILLNDDDGNCTVEIVPAFGAMLHAFKVSDTTGTLNIIDSYNDKSVFDNNAEPAGFKGLKLSPFPCRIQNASYHFNGKEYRFQKRLSNDAAIHGLLYREAFTVTKETVTGNEASLHLLCRYPATDPGYPFTYDCLVTYTLQRGNALTVTTSVTNTGNAPMPVADGWHPYFTFEKPVNGLELQFASEQMLEFVNLIPSGKTLSNPAFISGALIGSTELDNSFVLDFTASQPLCILRDPDSKWQLELYPEKSYPYLQVYIPPHRKSIAIENLSAPPDSFNNGMGLITLPPGKETSFSVKYVVQKKQ
ncbi:MAG: aldose 1-epimerase [Chitinophagaceae bacterium]|nr:aldose 1-epimerase [Chitinophagaceae bacterium]